MQRTSRLKSARLTSLLALFVFILSGTLASAQSSPQANPSPQARANSQTNTQANSSARVQASVQANAQPNVQAIKNVLERQVAAWNRGDIPAFMDGYWKSDDLEFVNAAGIFQGWQDVLKRYQHSYPDRAAMGHLTFSGVEIHALCPDAGFVVGHFRLDRELNEEKDGQKNHPEGVFTLIFRKFPAGWKIINDHTTEFPAPH